MKSKLKKRLSRAEEFEILKLVLDKFLWLGFGIMAYGLFKIFSGTPLGNTLVILISGAIILLLFLFLIVREYEIIR